MFDPHRIGPRRSSSYARNKGRVIQRRLVDTPSPGYTRDELAQLVPLMRKNGFFPSLDFGRLMSIRVIDPSGSDVSNNYRELTPEEIQGGVVDVDRGTYLLCVPGFSLFGEQSAVVFRPLNIDAAASYRFQGLTEGTRIYAVYPVPNQYIRLVLTGENGTSIRLALGSMDGYEDPASENVTRGAIVVMV